VKFEGEGKAAVNRNVTITSSDYWVVYLVNCFGTETGTIKINGSLHLFFASFYPLLLGIVIVTLGFSQANYPLSIPMDICQAANTD
jgi:hypothetical protein